MFGYHVVKSCGDGNPFPTIVMAIKWLRHRIPANIVQIFVAGPRSSRLLPESTITPLRNYITEENLEVIAHCAYIDKPFQLRGEKLKNCYKNIQRELDYAENSGISGFILHARDTSAEEVIRLLHSIKVPKSVTLYIENESTQDIPGTWNNPDNIVRNMAMIRKQFPRTGVCIDTSHLYSAGLSLASAKDARAFFDKIHRNIPNSNLLIHLNDSETELGSGHDVHAVIGKGNIWKEDTSGLFYIVKMIQRMNLRAIVELSYYKDIMKSFDTINQ